MRAMELNPSKQKRPQSFYQNALRLLSGAIDVGLETRANAQANLDTLVVYGMS